MIVIADTLDVTFDLMERGYVPFLGGTDLFVSMRKKGSKFDLVGIERLNELKGIDADGNSIKIGASITWEEIIKSPFLCEELPLLIDAARTIGAPAIRNMGTIGGNICTASPAGDGLLSLVAMGASLEVLSRDSMRIVPIEKFVTGPGRTTLREGEILSSIILDRTSWDGHLYRKVGSRKAMAISIGSIAALWSLDGRYVKDIRLVLGSMAPVPLRLHKVEALLRGSSLDDRTLWEEAKKRADKLVSPISDVRGSSRYRKLLVSNFIEITRLTAQRVDPDSR